MAVGINEFGLENSIRNLLDQIEQLNSVFNNLEFEIINIENNMQTENNLKLKEKCNKIHSQYQKIKQNIATYITDIENVISAYKNQDQQLSQIINANIKKLEERSN